MPQKKDEKWSGVDYCNDPQFQPISFYVKRFVLCTAYNLGGIPGHVIVQSLKIQS